MKLLLDTRTVLWALGSPARLSAATRAKLEDPRNTVLVSAVSAWELEIKRALGKLSTPDDLEEQLRAVRFGELPLRTSHAKALRSLPPIHRDPFDRMLVAQAVVERLVLVTRDARLSANHGWRSEVWFGT